MIISSQTHAPSPTWSPSILNRKNAYHKYYVSSIYSNFDMAPYMIVEKQILRFKIFVIFFLIFFFKKQTFKYLYQDFSKWPRQHDFFFLSLCIWSVFWEDATCLTRQWEHCGVLRLEKQFQCTAWLTTVSESSQAMSVCSGWCKLLQKTMRVMEKSQNTDMFRVWVSVVAFYWLVCVNLFEHV